MLLPKIHAGYSFILTRIIYFAFEELKLATIVRIFRGLSKAWKSFIDEEYLESSKYDYQLRWEKLVNSKPNRVTIYHPDENKKIVSDVNSILDLPDYKPYAGWVLSIEYHI